MPAPATDYLNERVKATKEAPPDDVRGSRATLEEAVLQDGWPTLRESRGKILFTLDNGGDYLRDYVGRGVIESTAIGMTTVAG